MQVKKVDYTAKTAARDFADSLQHTGFAVLCNHPIPWGMFEEAYQEWANFFSSEERFDYPFNPKTQDGYIPPELSETAKGYNLKDLKTFYHLYLPQGRYPKMLSPLTRELHAKMFALGKELLDWLDLYMPEGIKAKLRQRLPEMISMERTLMRILYYPPLTGNEESGAIRAEAHEDINLITVLPSATEAGLQLKDDKGQWHDVPLEANSLTINIGDMLQEASDHFYRSTTHRVVNPQGEAAKRARMTIPMFVHAQANAFISDRYPTAESYLDERLRELGLRKEKA